MSEFLQEFDGRLMEARLERRRERERLLSFLKRGGAIVREDVGGGVGVRWGKAHRCGRGFDAATCDKILEAGFTSEGVRYQLQRLDGPELETFISSEVPL